LHEYCNASPAFTKARWLGAWAREAQNRALSGAKSRGRPKLRAHSAVWTLAAKNRYNERAGPAIQPGQRPLRVPAGVHPGEPWPPQRSEVGGRGRGDANPYGNRIRSPAGCAAAQRPLSLGRQSGGVIEPAGAPFCPLLTDDCALPIAHSLSTPSSP